MLNLHRVGENRGEMRRSLVTTGRIVLLSGRGFFGSKIYLKYDLNSACWTYFSFSESIDDMKTFVVQVKSSRSLSTGWISSRLC